MPQNYLGCRVDSLQVGIQSNGPKQNMRTNLKCYNQWIQKQIINNSNFQHAVQDINKKILIQGKKKPCECYAKLIFYIQKIMQIIL